MRNRIGNEGCINISGIPGERAKMFLPSNSKGFWENIEQGIREVVKICNYFGLNTFSSCQGHSEGSQYCYVSIIDEKNEVLQLKKFLERKIFKSKIHIILKTDPYMENMDIYEGKYESPYILKIIFGKYNDSGLEKKKEVFCSWIGYYNKY